MNKENGDINKNLLYNSILSLENMDDCKNFFEDLCTESELIEMSRRLVAAKMLHEGHLYTEIAQKTGLSTATISRVNHCIKFGSGGYSVAIDNIKRKENRRKYGK